MEYSGNRDLLEEAKRIQSGAIEKNVLLRILGGLAIKHHCPSFSRQEFSRAVHDIDLIGLSKQRKKIDELFLDLGYEPNVRFNRFQGKRRLLYRRASVGDVDVFLDFFYMCHTFNLRKRLTIDPFTISLSDLLVTKVQIIEMNEKDIKDIIALLLDHEIGDEDIDEIINRRYIASLCSDNWGVYRTITMNMNKVLAYIKQKEYDRKISEVTSLKVLRLMDAIEKEPKSLGWRLRASVGDKMRWYEVPEEGERPAIKIK